MSPVEFQIAAPRAGLMIESLRAFGYDLSTALADLIDNSITAKARNIWLDFHWNGADSAICVIDDGRGMSPGELLDAMRPGSRSPLEERDPEDLGRFGLGLKTASFSQCRRLTVRSRNEVTADFGTMCWDLDYVNDCDDWRVLMKGSVASKAYFKRLDKLPTGTGVLWEYLDRLVSDDNVDSAIAQDLFLSRIDALQTHLAMVFHRFLKGQSGINIRINNRLVEPWDPFLEGEPATQRLPIERLSLRGHEVIIVPYVLPHHSKIDAEVHEAAAGPRGWNAHQGFYVYRNRRLLVAGDWLGLDRMQKEEHYKLARIMVDIPNSLDSDWSIDARKARARPPRQLVRDIRRIAARTRQEAVRIYRYRGKTIARNASADWVFAWEKKVKHGKVFYRINRSHPLVKAVLASPSEERPQIAALLRLLEETVPVPLISIDSSERPDSHAQPFEGSPSREILNVLQALYTALIAQGVPHAQAQQRISAMEPFHQYPELVAAYIEKLNHEGADD